MQGAGVILGFETSDDAAVYRLSDDIAAVLTVDFFTPVVDDPYLFGRIAAANALSDIYAMGAEPKAALNLLALDSALGTGLAGAILRGGADAVREAGATIVGGHTIDDAEPKYGLAVFGTAHPDAIVRNSGAMPGDLLYLTKPLGTGIMSSALQVGLETEASLAPVLASMEELNDRGARAMKEAGAHAATDVTGFGFAGHLHEMLVASKCSALLDWAAIPVFDKAWEYSRQYCRPARSFSIMDHVGESVLPGGLAGDEYDTRMGILCDPQTSGGLLLAIPPHNQKAFEQAYRSHCEKGIAAIGTVTSGDPGTMGFIG
jgi:selenide,water dikinase